MKETSLLLGSAAFALGTTMLNKMQAEGQQIGGLASWGSVNQGTAPTVNVGITNTGSVPLTDAWVKFEWTSSVHGLLLEGMRFSLNPQTSSSINFNFSSNIPTGEAVGTKNAKVTIEYPDGSVIAELTGTFNVTTGVAASIISVTITV